MYHYWLTAESQGNKLIFGPKQYFKKINEYSSALEFPKIKTITKLLNALVCRNSSFKTVRCCKTVVKYIYTYWGNRLRRLLKMHYRLTFFCVSELF